MSAQFDPVATFTRITRTDGGLLTKAIRPDGKGGVIKEPAAAMTTGTAETVALPFSQIGTLLRSLKPNQALAHGVTGHDRINIVSAAKFAGQADTITRTKEYFHYPDGWGIGMLDHDPKPGQDALSPAQLFEAVAAVWPAFADLPKAVSGSTGAYVFDQTGKQLTGRGSGFHCYFPIKPAAASPGLAKILLKRLWLTGHGYIAISAAGSMLVRTIFDASVFSPERLDFCAGARCVGCEQRLPAPDYHLGHLQEDAEIPLPRPLTPTEEAAFNALVAVAKEQARPAAEEVRAAREKQEIKILQEKRGIDPEAAAAIVKARHEGRLEPGDFIQFQDGRLPAVAEILASPEQYHGQPCADPLEPEYGTGKAKLFVNDSGSIVINSFLHGGQTYMLRQPGDPQTDFAGLGDQGGADQAGQEQPAAIDPAALLGRYEVKTEYVEKLGKEEFLIENLLVSGHILVVIAMSGGGKTAFWFRYAAPLLAGKGLSVWYLDADSPASEHKIMKELADKHKFRLLNPDANVGAGIAEMRKDLEKIATSDHDLSGWVLIFDTLKKFTDLMSKGSVKDFFALCRKLTSKGATVVLLGHANKYRSKPEGHLIAEGVGDVRSDTDELIFFERKKNENTGGLDITTDVDPDHGSKVRGIFRPFSFHIGPDREVTIHEKVVEVPDYTLTATPTATEEEIIDAAAGFLAEAGEPVAQSTLVSQVRAMVTAGRDRVRALIVANSMKDGGEGNKRFVYTIGARGRLDYSLPQREPEQGEMFETEASFRRESSFLN